MDFACAQTREFPWLGPDWVVTTCTPQVGGLVAALSHMVVVGGPAAWLEALAAIKLQPPGGGAARQAHRWGRADQGAT